MAACPPESRHSLGYDKYICSRRVFSSSHEMGLRPDSDEWLLARSKVNMADAVIDIKKVFKTGFWTYCRRTYELDSENSRSY